MIYRTPTSYQVIRAGSLYTCDISLKHFRRVASISDKYTPSGALVRNPSKRLIFYFQNQINKIL